MKKIMSMILLCMLLGACGKASVAIKENIVIEYGSELKVEELTEEKVTLKEVKDYDAKKVGEQKVIAVFVNEKDKEIEEEITLEVKDTKKPEIKLKKDKVEITESDKFDPVSNIESIKDPVDGDIKKSDDTKLSKDGYLINSDVDNQKAGSYTVTITAYDVNGNKAESNYQVTVKEKAQEQAAVQQNTTQPTYTAPQQSGNGNSGSYGAAASTTQSKPQTPSTSTSKPSGSCNHRGEKMVEGMWFDTDDELDAWAWEYQNKQWDKGINIGGAYGVYTCPDCGKVGIHRFY